MRLRSSLGFDPNRMLTLGHFRDTAFSAGIRSHPTCKLCKLLAISIAYCMAMQTCVAQLPPAIQPRNQLLPEVEQIPKGQQRILISDEEEELLFQQGAFPRMTRQGMRESLFSGLGGSEAAFQTSRREKIRREIDRIDSVCSLTTEQKEKLDIAIEIDIQYLLNKIETVISKYDSKMTVQQFQQIQTEVQKIVGSIPSATKEPEIWRKVLHSQLTEVQRDLLEDDTRSVAQNQSRTKQLGMLLRLQRKLGLTKAQRESVSSWLANKDGSHVLFASLLVELESLQEMNWTPAQRTILKTHQEPSSLPVDTVPLMPLVLPR